MTIKEVSEKYGISQDTLRYYERVNVIPKVTRTSGGIRDYQEEDLRWVELAVCMRNAGLPIQHSLLRQGLVLPMYYRCQRISSSLQLLPCESLHPVKLG